MRFEGIAMNEESSVSERIPVGQATEVADGIIVATKVPAHRRLEFLPLHFGPKLMLRVELGIYGWMNRLCPAYSGGYWEFIELSNGGAYMSPSEPAHFDLSVEGNHIQGRLSADAAGIVATTFALNELIWKGNDTAHQKYDALIEFIHQHPEREAILCAID
jgi:Antirestriction protein